MKPFRCPECGGEVRLSTGTGRTTHYHKMVLPLPDDMKLPTCNKCGERYVDSRTAKMVDEVAKPLYRAKLCAMAKAAIDQLTQSHKQYTVEKALCLSHGYLSHLRAGKRTPTAELVGHLTMLARHPAQVQELESIWAAA